MATRTKVKVTPERFGELAEYAASDGALFTNAREATHEDLVGLFRNAY